MNILHTAPPSLPKKFKKNSFLFIFFSIIAVFLETFSLGLIFPLMEGLINGNFTKNLLGINFTELQKNYNHQNIIEWLMFLIIILFFFKTIFLIFFNYWKLKFSSSISPVLTDTTLIETSTVSSRYCLLAPMPKYLAPIPPVSRLVL